MKNKCEKNEKNIYLVTLVILMDKMDRGGENKEQRLHRCCSNYAVSKLIIDNGLDDLWRRENPDSSEFTRYDRSSGTRSSLGRIYIDINIANNTKINHLMISFTDHYNAISIERLPSKAKIGKVSWYFNNSLLSKPNFCSTKSNLLSLLKTQKQPLFR